MCCSGVDLHDCSWDLEPTILFLVVIVVVLPVLVVDLFFPWVCVVLDFVGGFNGLVGVL